MWKKSIAVLCGAVGACALLASNADARVSSRNVSSIEVAGPAAADPPPPPPCNPLYQVCTDVIIVHDPY